MKHLKKWSCSFLIVSVLLTACQDDGSFDSFPKEENLLIPQAREFYENVISEAAENGTLIQNRNMSPGEVTPRWHEAYLKQDTQYEYVYVPIHAERNYIRQVEMKKNGHKKTYNVYISQTLCVRKDREGKYSAAYITMMPSLSHYRRNKNQFTEKVIKSETLYGDFSGYVAYNNIATSGLMVIDKVEKGKCQWALSRETPIEKDSIWTLFKEAYKNIYSINISLTRHTIDGGSHRNQTGIIVSFAMQMYLMTTFVQIIVMVKANQSLGMAMKVTVWMLVVTVVVEVAAEVEAGEEAIPQTLPHILVKNLKHVPKSNLN